MTRSPTAHGEMIAGWELGNLRRRLRLESNSEVHHTDENDHTLHSDLESKKQIATIKILVDFLVGVFEIRIQLGRSLTRSLYVEGKTTSRSLLSFARSSG